MGRGFTTRVGYGVHLYCEDKDWLVKEVQEDYDFEYTVPWMQCIDEDDQIDYRKHLLRYLLHNLPENPPGDEILDLSEFDLNDMLEKRTGLIVETFGKEYGRTALIAPTSKDHYGLDPLELTPEKLTVTDEQVRWMDWAIEALRVDLTDKPSLKVLVSYG